VSPPGEVKKVSFGVGRGVALRDRVTPGEDPQGGRMTVTKSGRLSKPNAWFKDYEGL